MERISGINKSTGIPSLHKWKRFAKNLAKIVDSRESTYRLALDIVAFDIPTIGAALFRNFWNLLEATWEAGIGTVMVFSAPHITSFVGKIVSKVTLKPEEQKYAKHYLRFQMAELTNVKAMEKGLERINIEEPKDQNRVASLYIEAKKEEKAKHYENKSKEIKDFYNDFKDRCTDEVRKKIYRLKRAVIIGESLIEGGVWGSFGLNLRWFRKNILQKDRFTGTMSYLSDAESSGLGEGSELSTFQKIWGTGAIFLSPILNTFLLKKTQNRTEVAKSKFLSTVDSHLDMTHGVFPKLGLLFTYTSIPKWTSLFITSQGWYERLERIFKFLTILPSWWLGHRVTNGLLAKKADKELSRKYNLKEGVLLEAEYLKPKETTNLSFFDKLKYLCPEPARIHHVLDSVELAEQEKLAEVKGNEEKEKAIKEHFVKIREEAEDLHCKTLYKGFALHSFLVWVITMLVNYSTKLRVKYALGE